MAVNENYYTIITSYGKRVFAEANASGKTVQLTEFAVGDGGGSYYAPNETQTALVNEIYRAPINRITTDPDNPNWVIIEGIIPADQGGFTIREVGIFDKDGNLILIGNYPETYKPVLSQGAGNDLYIRVIMEVENVDSVELKIDPTVVIASQQYVQDKIASHNADTTAHSDIRNDLNAHMSDTTAHDIPNQIANHNADINAHPDIRDSVKFAKYNGINFKNRIINGDFSVRQRGVNTISNQQDFILDRFQAQTHGSIIVAKDLLVPISSVSLVDNVDPFGDGSGVALYKFDGNALDASGNYNGTWTGTEQYDTGIFGQAAKFDGNSYITLSAPIDISTRTYTISFWAKDIGESPDGYAAGIINKNSGDYTNVPFYYRGKLYFGSERDPYINQSDLPTNQFYHLVAVYINNNITVYLNGNNVLTLTTSSNNYDSLKFLMNRPYSGNHILSGYVDQVRIFNKALTVDEIKKLYTEESQIINKPYSITLKTGNKPSDYTTQTVKPLVYRFEGQHLYDLITEGKKVTLSFNMTAKKPGKYSVSITNKTTSPYETLLQTFDYNGNQDEKVSVTFDLSQFQNEVRNDENLGCELVICGYTEDSTLVGTVGRNTGEKICTSDCMPIDNNDTISVTKLQLEEGDIATDFEYIPYDIQLIRCMRYYEKGYVGGAMHWASGREFAAILNFKVQKRTIPTMSFPNVYFRYNTTAYEIAVLDKNGGILMSNISADYIDFETDFIADAEL